MSIFQYDFMLYAFIVGLLLSIVIPCIGMVVVLKRLSMIGDALSHSALAGVAAGLVLGINPVAGAIVMCIFAALCIEAIRRKVPQYSEMAIAIVMSVGIGLASVLLGFVNNTTGSVNFNSFLFGSIVTISTAELSVVVLISVCVMIAYVLLYKELFLVAFDERIAKLAGVPVRLVNFIFTVLTAVTIAIASRIVGALIVSSIMVVPIACSMQLAKSYKQTIVLAVCLAVLFTVIGLFASYYLELKPSGAIVLVGVLAFILILLFKKIFSRQY